MRLADLPEMHPSLLWDDIAAAAVAAFEDRSFAPPFELPMNIEHVPGYGSGELTLEILDQGISAVRIEKLRRTMEAHRLVELAAIAIAGLALHAAGGHMIRDVALRGSSADYLVGEENHLLEVAGRSRRRDLQAAWDDRWSRIESRRRSGFFVCVVEFESPSGRLAFAA